MSKPVCVLYLGSLTHSQQFNSLDKTKPHQDIIDFQHPVKITLIRIPKAGKDIYSRHISITQNQLIKNFEIYFRNLQKTTGKYSLLTFNNQLLASSNDDILITPKQPIFTDLLLIKGNYLKITFCIYGNLIKDELTLHQRCPNYKMNAPIESFNLGLIKIEKDIFEEKRDVIKEIEKELNEEKNVKEWNEVINDDGINEQQIENICNLSQKLLSSFNSQNLLQQSFIVSLRTALQQISANLAKIFKNKHLGLYYPSYEDSNISNELPIILTKLALDSLELSFSQQFRALEILKFTVQLDKHAEFFIQNQGIDKLLHLFVEFFKSDSVILSTYKNLLLQVLISLSQWRKGAQTLIMKIKDSFYYQLFQVKSAIDKNNDTQERQRSRQKKAKKSISNSSASSDDEPKKKKKQKKKNKDKDKEKEKDKKKGKQSKSKQQIAKKSQQIQEQKKLSIVQQIQFMSFYEILLFELAKQKNIKQIMMIKILIEQINQTILKDNISSQRVSLITSLLKDTKYVFNPSGQVLNTKTLKQFANYYTFLNNVQSQGVQIDLISQKQKLKNLQKYGIKLKTCKILNRINIQLASKEYKQYQNDVKTPFDSSFIVMMSELVRQKSTSIFYGFQRILNSFKIQSSNDIIYLKKVQAAMTMISQYIYKILLQDKGLYTVLNLDQIYNSLINITNCLSKDPSAFTKQLKKNIKKLTNYSLLYDLFNRSEGNFKTLSDYFLKLFKFEHYQINKISDYKKKQFDKISKKFLISNLNQSMSLGNFQQLFPQQPLLQIDVYLKLFNMILQYNKNIWTLFYQNKLVCGFSVLYLKLTNIIIFLVKPSYQRESVILNMKKLQQNTQNYLTVLERLLQLLVKKSQYQAAFNDLIDEDNFQYVQIYSRSLQLYFSLFNALNSNGSLLNQKERKLSEKILAKIIKIFDKLIESYELTSHISRQTKIKQLWHTIYVLHFTNLQTRTACLSLFSFFIETLQNASLKLFNTYCIDQNIKTDSYIQNKLPGYLPQNQKNIVQNLILYNVFRKDKLIQNNLYTLIRNLLDKQSDKNPICDKITQYLQQIFDQIQIKFRQNYLLNIQSIKELKIFEKMELFTCLLKNVNNTLTLRFQQKIIKFLRYIDNLNKYDNIQIFSSQNKYILQVIIYLIKIKKNIILFLKKSFSEKKQHSHILTFIQILNKNLEPNKYFSYFINNQGNQYDHKEQIRNYLNLCLNLTNATLSVLCAISSNTYNQSIILYEVFLERPYKPVPQISFINLFNKLISEEMKKYLNTNNSISDKIKNSIILIFNKIIYFLCQLTTINGNQFYSTQSRRNAIICLVTEQRQFPFSKLQKFYSFLQPLFIKNLNDYFNYPIIEKTLTLKQQIKKQHSKNKGYIFSKSIFSIIMQGQLVAKNRFQYIGSVWKSGDLNSKILYTPTKERNYSEAIKRFIQKNIGSQDQQILIFDKQKMMSLKNIYQPEQIYELTPKKRIKIVQKKATVDCLIKLLNIPLVLENQNQYMRMDMGSVPKKKSPSPLNKYPSQNIQKINPTNINEIDPNIRTSPSPPSIKIPNQNLIGFNSPQQNNNYSMISQNNYASSKSIETVAYQNSNYMMQSPSNIQPSFNYQNNPNNLINPIISPSNDVNMNPIRSSSDSAGRILPPQNTHLSQTYSNQLNQTYYNSNNQSYGIQLGYSNSVSYDNRNPTTYPKNYTSNYPNMGTRNYNLSTNSYYSSNYMNQSNVTNPYGSSYGQSNIPMNPRSNMMPANMLPNRPAYNNIYNSPYGSNNYSNKSSIPPYSNYVTPANVNYANYNMIQQDKQFNQAILLVTQLRGNIPEQMKNQKKNRLNSILVNPKIQIRVRDYINNLK